MTTNQHTPGRGGDYRKMCRCSQDCDSAVAWMSRAPMAACHHDGECRCECHIMALEFAAARERVHASGFRYKHEA